MTYPSGCGKKLFIVENITILIILMKILNKKYLFYAIWYSFVTIIAMLIYRGGLGDNTQGAMCMPYDWQYGKMYQWIWDGTPCVYSLEFYLGYYIFSILLYIVFDIVRRKIVGFNSSYLFRICEGLGWFLLNYGYLLWITKNNYGNIDFTMCLMAFLGVLVFILPLFSIFVLMRYFGR